MKQTVTITFLLFSLLSNAQNTLPLVPAPAEINISKGNFTISPSTVLVIKNGVDDNSAAILTDAIKKQYGFSLKKVKAAAANFIQLTTLQTLLPGKENAYALTVNSKAIIINGQTASGTFSGIQTLLQLLPVTGKTAIVPQLSITDYPRFAYRGMHLDVGRHFFPASFIKKYIDYLAAYKYNTFHWHLTEDQGWRIEIKKYPLLTKAGGYRNGTLIGRYPGKGNDSLHYGGYYTQQEIKDIVKYAADRYITIIPEIEMPGHASAAIAAYPQLSCFPNENTSTTKSPWAGSKQGKQVQQTWGVFEDVFAPTDYTFSFLQDVLDEVMDLFPSKYIHIGGDECPKEAWKRSELCQQLIKANNLKDEHGLQSYFIGRIEKYLNSKGRNIIGWDEILEGGLAPNATVMSWRGEEGGIEAAKQNHDVIMTPGKPVYFDYSQSKNEDSVTIGGYNSLEMVYNYEPVPAALNEQQAAHVLGAQANVWTEYMKYPGKVEYMIFPRMLALSEVLWSPKAKRNWSDFERRIPLFFTKLEKQGINHSKAYYDLNPSINPSANEAAAVEWNVSSKNKDENLEMSYTGPLRIFLQQQGKGNVTMPITKQGNYKAVSKISGISLSQTFYLNKATGKKITLATAPAKNYPGDGAFTLVNGVQNEKGLSKNSEFIGFSGSDLDAVIDLGAVTEVKKVILHTYGQPGSWIYLPQKVEVQFLMNLDTDNPAMLGPTHIVSVDVEQQTGNVKIEVPAGYSCRYIKLLAKNFGNIPTGFAGAGHAAWLFADEIEVE
jgi:hexosaminidase